MRKIGFVLAALLIVTSCDESINERKKALPPDASKITEVSLRNEKHLEGILTTVGFTNSGNGRVNQSTGVSINTEKILKVNRDDSERNNYTFNIKNDGEPNSFSNLVIEELSMGYQVYILRYEPTGSFKGMRHFSGAISRLTVNGDLLSVTEMEDGQQVESGARVAQEAQCVADIIITTYCLEPIPGGGTGPFARASAASSEYCWDEISVISGPCPQDPGPYYPPGGGGSDGGTGGTGGTGGGTSGGGSSGGGDTGSNCRCPGDGSGGTGGTGGTGGSGGSGGSGGGVGVINDQFENNVEQPCIRDMVDRALSDELTNAISKEMQEKFGAEGFGIDFSDVTHLQNNVDGQVEGWQGDGVGIPPSNVLLSIVLNLNTLPGATQEYIMATVYHEIAHALVIAKLGVHSTELDQHIAIAADYRLKIEQALREHFPNMTQQAAADLSWGGLGDTPAFQNLSETDRVRIAGTNSKQKIGKGGLKCPAGVN